MSDCRWCYTFTPTHKEDCARGFEVKCNEKNLSIIYFSEIFLNWNLPLGVLLPLIPPEFWRFFLVVEEERVGKLNYVSLNRARNTDVSFTVHLKALSCLHREAFERKSSLRMNQQIQIFFFLCSRTASLVLFFI